MDSEIDPALDAKCEDGEHAWLDDVDHDTRYCSLCGVVAADDLETYDRAAIGESFGQDALLYRLTATQTGDCSTELGRYLADRLKESKTQIETACQQLRHHSCAPRVLFMLDSALRYARLPKRGSAFKFGRQSLCFQMAAIKHACHEDGVELSYEEVMAPYSHLVAHSRREQSPTGRPHVTKYDVGRQMHFLEWLAAHHFKPGADDDYVEPGHEGLLGQEDLARDRLVRAGKKRKRAADGADGDGDAPARLPLRADFFPDLFAAFERPMDEIKEELPALKLRPEARSVRFLNKAQDAMADARQIATVLADVAPHATARPEAADVRAEAAYIVIMALQAAVGSPAPKTTAFYPILTRIVGSRPPQLGRASKHLVNWLNDQLYAQPWFGIDDLFAQRTFRAKKLTNRTGLPKLAVTIPEWKHLVVDHLGPAFAAAAAASRSTAVAIASDAATPAAAAAASDAPATPPVAAIAAAPEEVEGADAVAPVAGPSTGAADELPAIPVPSMTEDQERAYSQLQLLRMSLQRARVLLASWKRSGVPVPKGLAWADMFRLLPEEAWPADEARPELPMLDDRPVPSLNPRLEMNHPDVLRHQQRLDEGVPLAVLFEDPIRPSLPAVESDFDRRIREAGGVATIDRLDEEPDKLDAVLFAPDELETLVRSADEAERFAATQADQVALWEEHSRLNERRAQERATAIARQAIRAAQTDRREQQAVAWAGKTPALRGPLFVDAMDAL